ncbi:unnamed protein product [Haemonchus placei]|uniref:Uncharacterized protein n=1 Tax=Haemonchus placei TaxID=6290 RepID=A0A0N4X2G2_HAEPC|nr:unnamed protein product [Haemonchus placei]
MIEHYEHINQRSSRRRVKSALHKKNGRIPGIPQPQHCRKDNPERRKSCGLTERSQQFTRTRIPVGELRGRCDDLVTIPLSNRAEKWFVLGPEDDFGAPARTLGCLMLPKVGQTLSASRRQSEAPLPVRQYY